MKCLSILFYFVLIILLKISRSAAQPRAFKLYQNEPHPFDRTGNSIRYDLAMTCYNQIWLTSSTGSFVKTLVNGQYAAGYYMVRWYARDENSDVISPGTYIGNMTANSGTNTIFRNAISMQFQLNSEPFTDIYAALLALNCGTVAWGDYDYDNDLDILQTGTEGSFNSGVHCTKIYRNCDGNFIDIDASLIGARNNAVAWGDYDSDGNLDFILTGDSNLGKCVANIYRNDNGRFVEMDFRLTGASFGSVSWGDYDNVGDFDIFLTGFNAITDSIAITKVYCSENGNFADIDAGLPGMRDSDAAWGDYENDGDLDVFLTCNSEAGKITKIYRNNSAAANTNPTAPINLFSLTQDNSVTFNWQPASDNQTQQSALTYNLRFIITPNGCETMTPRAEPLTCYQRVPQSGNTYHRTSWTLTNLHLKENYNEHTKLSNDQIYKL